MFHVKAHCKKHDWSPDKTDGTFNTNARDIIISIGSLDVIDCCW